jgi:hypothetical protein
MSPKLNKQKPRLKNSRTEQNQSQIKKNIIKKKCSTFRDINVAFQVINIEAPEETRDEVKESSSNVVTKPSLQEMRQSDPPIGR